MPDITDIPVTKMVVMPRSMSAVRFRPERQCEVVGGSTPLVDPKGRTEAQVQLRLVAHTKIFNLLDEKDLEEYNKTWQLIADDKAILAQHQLITAPDGSVVRAYLRWGDKTFKVQGQ